MKMLMGFLCACALSMLFPDMALASDKPAKSTAKSCAQGQIGGVVASVVKKGDLVVVNIKGDKIPFNIPKNAGESYAKATALKPGDLYCVKDDGA